MAATKWRTILSSHGFGIPLLAPIPTAAFGLGILPADGPPLPGACRCAFVRDDLGHRRAAMGMSLIGVLMSAWLTFLEKYVIHGWCPGAWHPPAIILLIFVTMYHGTHADGPSGARLKPAIMAHQTARSLTFSGDFPGRAAL